MANESREYDLDDRLLDYSASIVIFFVSIRTANKNVVRESPPETYAGES